MKTSLALAALLILRRFWSNEYFKTDAATNLGLNFAKVPRFIWTFRNSGEGVMRLSFRLIASLGAVTALSVGSVNAAGRGGGGGGPPSFATGGGGGGPASSAAGQSAAPTSSGPTFSNGNPPGFSEGNKTGFESGEPKGWTEGKKKGWNCTLTDPDCRPPGLKGR
jgi:hypothetical protein